LALAADSSSFASPDPNPNNNQSPVTNLASLSFSRYLVVGDPRIMQFALKYSF
jgi:hypothetical protein